MDRQELEMMTRDELLATARACGIDGAEWLSREELVTTLCRASATGKPRGLFERAKALFDRAIELGQKFGKPGRASQPPPPAPPPPRPTVPDDAGPSTSEGAQASEAAKPSDADGKAGEAGTETSVEDEFETLTMAEVYAAQGLAEQALKIVRAIVAREPGNTAAAALLARIEAQLEAAKPPPPWPMFLDLEEPPERYGEDVISLLMVEPSLVYVYWEVTSDGRARAQASLGERGYLTLRLFSARADETATRDESVDDSRDLGEFFFHGAVPGARHRVAIGLMTASGQFAPIAHSSPTWTPSAQPSADTRVEWMKVLPPSERSPEPSPPTLVESRPADAREQAQARRRAIEGWPMGSSDIVVKRTRPEAS